MTPEENEREHCRAAVRALFNHEQTQGTVRFVDVRDLLLRERAAAVEQYKRSIESP